MAQSKKKRGNAHDAFKQYRSLSEELNEMMKERLEHEELSAFSQMQRAVQAALLPNADTFAQLQQAVAKFANSKDFADAVSGFSTFQSQVHELIKRFVERPVAINEVIQSATLNFSKQIEAIVAQSATFPDIPSKFPHFGDLKLAYVQAQVLTQEAANNPTFDALEFLDQKLTEEIAKTDTKSFDWIAIIALVLAFWGIYLQLQGNSGQRQSTDLLLNGQKQISEQVTQVYSELKNNLKYRTTRNAHLRVGPSTHQSSISVLTKGTSVRLLDGSGKWMKVLVDDSSGIPLVGWVYRNLLNVQKPLTTDE